jgi:aspartyl-tRNA(Asn)/glutamyl-tRNA(Gln) amidotransferase subunit A
MSFDQIGVIGKNIDDVLLLLNVIRGKDERDATSLESGEIKIEKTKKIKIGLPEIDCDKEIWNLVKKKVDGESINIPHLDLGVQTYYPIVFTEFFSGTRKFDGRRFGKKIEEACGEEVLRRILGGKEITQAEYDGKYYRKALQAKALITKELEEAFKEYDVLVMPTLPILPWKVGANISIENEYASDALTVIANIAGIPAISIPAGKIRDIPVGLQIIGKKFSEGLILSLAKELENGK